MWIAEGYQLVLESFYTDRSIMLRIDISSLLTPTCCLNAPACASLVCTRFVKDVREVIDKF